MTFISSLIIPIMVLTVIIYGYRKKVNLYDTFIDGAKESFELVATILPHMLGMFLAINIFLKSGILNSLAELLEPLLNLIAIPFEILPMAIMRSISGNSTLAIMADIFAKHGPDSFVGRLASIIQGSSDTTFYVMTLYFGTVGIKKIRYAMVAGLLADLIGIIASIVIVNIFF